MEKINNKWIQADLCRPRQLVCINLSCICTIPVLFITLHLYRNVWINCFNFFSDVDSETTEGNTENEQEDVHPVTGEPVCFLLML